LRRLPERRPTDRVIDRRTGLASDGHRGGVSLRSRAAPESHPIRLGEHVMAFTYFENTAQLDDWLVSFDKVPQAADK
jgi:hypothetical protein